MSAKNKMLIDYSLAENFNQGMFKLLSAVQQLSLARDLQSIVSTVKYVARDLTGSDGSTFVLKDNDKCYYVDEFSISPLWKGQRFPMSICISGWVMNNKSHVAIEDIYKDARIPHAAYKPTFVKSLTMVPIRISNPIGAIGNYWSQHHISSATEIQILQALADSTSIAMENVNLYQELENRVQDRTAQLEYINKELESFSYSVSHDLRAPLRAIDGFSRALEEDYSGSFDEKGKDYFSRVHHAIDKMSNLIDDLLKLSRLAQTELIKSKLNLSEMAQKIINDIKKIDPYRDVEINIEPNLEAFGDENLIFILLENLFNNAWKYTGKTSKACITFGQNTEENIPTFYIKDNGAGFKQEYSDKLFIPFQRLHTESEFVGTGIGLVICARIIHRHSGKITGNGEVDKGATFYFTLPH